MKINYTTNKNLLNQELDIPFNSSLNNERAILKVNLDLNDLLDLLIKNKDVAHFHNDAMKPMSYYFEKTTDNTIEITIEGYTK